jgi:hypothetical protein
VILTKNIKVDEATKCLSDVTSAGENSRSIIKTLRSNSKPLLFGLKRPVGSHSGENMAQLLVKVIKTYNLARVLGFCVLDNVGDNNTSLRIVEAFLLTQGVI